MRFALLLFLSVFSLWSQSPGRLRIYAIDVEGGKATLYVSPSGESMLVDAGYSGSRDAGRIAAAAKAAGISRIDYLVITHYHPDHAGGVAPLAALMPIGAFYDHGDDYQGDPKSGVFHSYKAVRDGHPHTALRAGDTIPVKGLTVQVVAASGNVISQPLPGAGEANPSCRLYVPIVEDPGEHSRSLALVITYGRFRVADFGDLYWNREHDLVCPVDKIGRVDLYMTTDHGKASSGSPQMIWALHPHVAIMNNSPSRGGSAEAVQILRRSPDLMDIWQLHFSNTAGVMNSPEDLVANPSSRCVGFWIEVSAGADGSFNVSNSRNQFEKSYPAGAPAHMP